MNNNPKPRNIYHLQNPNNNNNKVIRIINLVVAFNLSSSVIEALGIIEVDLNNSIGSSIQKGVVIFYYWMTNVERRIKITSA